MGINTNSKSIVSLLRLRTLLRFCFRIRILKHIGKKIFFMQGQWNTGFCLLLLLLLTWRHSLTLNRRIDTEISEADILLSCCCYLLLFVCVGFFWMFFCSVLVLTRWGWKGLLEARWFSLCSSREHRAVSSWMLKRRVWNVQFCRNKYLSLAK